MKPLFLLDTNVVSEPLRAAPRPGVLQKLSRHRAELAIASVVWHELWFGAERLQFRAEKHAAVEISPIEGLDAEPIADEVKHPFAPVP